MKWIETLWISKPYLYFLSMIGFINETDVAGNSILYKAVYRRDDGLVSKLITLKKIDVNIANNYGVTPLHEAVLKGDVKICQLLLSCPNINIHLQSVDGMTPFLWACRYGVEEILNSFLVRNDVRYDITNNFGYNCFDILDYKHPHLLPLVLARYEKRELSHNIAVSATASTVAMKRLKI